MNNYYIYLDDTEPENSESNNKIFTHSIVIPGYNIEKDTLKQGRKIYKADKDGKEYIIKIVPYCEEKLKWYKEIENITKNETNLLKIVETGSIQDNNHVKHLYEVCEYLNFGSIANVPTDRLKLIQDNLKLFIGQISSAINFLHKNNFWHMDIKPSNILIKSLNPLNFVLSDYGTLIKVESGVDSKGLDDFIGTIHYRSHEVTNRIASKNSDYWSFGMTLIKLLHKQHYLFSLNDERKIHNNITHSIPIPKSITPDIQYLLKGLLTGMHWLRWGYVDICNWLNENEPNPPIHYDKNNSNDNLIKIVDKGKGAEFTSLSGAYANVENDGGIITLTSGTFEIGKLDIKKNISLRSEDKCNPILKSYRGFLIDSEVSFYDLTIKGVELNKTLFTISEGGQLTLNNCTIHNRMSLLLKSNRNSSITIVNCHIVTDINGFFINETEIFFKEENTLASKNGVLIYDRNKSKIEFSGKIDIIKPPKSHIGLEDLILKENSSISIGTSLNISDIKIAINGTSTDNCTKEFIKKYTDGKHLIEYKL